VNKFKAVIEIEYTVSDEQLENNYGTQNLDEAAKIDRESMQESFDQGYIDIQDFFSYEELVSAVINVNPV
jgi:hypothetical protein